MRASTAWQPAPALACLAASWMEDSSQLMRVAIGVNAMVVSVLARASVLVTDKVTAVT